MSRSLLDQLLQLPTVSIAKLSPDSKWLAFVWANAHKNYDVFLVPTNGSVRPISLTNTPEFTYLVGWTPDSKAVIVEEDHDNDERVSLFRVDLDNPENMVRLTEDHPSYFLRGGDLHPDGRHLFYGMNFDLEIGKEIEQTLIYRHDLQNGERSVLVSPKAAAWTTPSLNKAGTHLIYGRQDRSPDGYQFHLVDINGKEDREILNFGDTHKVWARWHPDSEHIIFHTESTDGNPQEHISLGIYHLPTGEICWLIDDPDRSIESAWISPDGLIIVNEVVDARRAPSYIDLETGDETRFPDIPGNIMPIGKTPEDKWIALHYAANKPTELVSFNLADNDIDDLHSLTHVWERTSLSSDALYPAEDFRWESVDGLGIQGWLYRAEPNNKQAVIYVHGGPTSHSEDKLNVNIQHLVSQGFNVLDVNYRGSTGFGLKFREAIKEDGWGGREQDDIAAGAKALITNQLADPGKIGVTGTSYGGYSAWCQITHQPVEIISASVPICGMTDLVIDYQTTRPDLRPYSEEMIGGTPDEVPEKYKQRSPINFVQQIRGALLIVQGGMDPNVTPENVNQVIARLKEHNIPYDILVFENEGHGVIKPENKSRLLQQTAVFFKNAFSTPNTAA